MNEYKFTEALTSFIEAAEIGERNGLSESLMNINANLGIVYFLQNKNEKALQYYKIVLENEKKLQNPIIQTNVLNNLGLLYYNMNEKDKALNLLIKALKVAEENKFLFAQSNAHLNIGNIYKDKLDIAEATRSFEKSLSISKNIGYLLNQASAYLGLGEIYREKLELDKALDFYDQAIGTAKRCNNFQLIALAYISIGHIYRNEIIQVNNITNDKQIMEYKNKAINFFEESLKMLKKIKDSHNQRIALLMIGDTYIELDNPYLALDAYKQALELITEKRLRSESIGHIIKTAQLFFKKHLFTESTNTLSNIIKMYEASGDDFKKFKILNLIGRNYFYQKDMDKALYSYQEALNILSMNNNRLIKLIEEDSEFNSYKYSYNLKYVFHKKKYDSKISNKSRKSEIALMQDFIFDKKAEIFYNIGCVYSFLNKFNDSLVNYKKSTYFYEKCGNYYGKGQALHATGNIYSKLGNIEKSVNALKEAKFSYIKAKGDLSTLQKQEEQEIDRLIKYLEIPRAKQTQ